MEQSYINTRYNEESDLIRVLNIFTKHYKIFIISVVGLLVVAFLYNRYAIPVFGISATLLIQEEGSPEQMGGNAENFINSELFNINQSLQNELYILQSSPVIEQAIINLNLITHYFLKEGFRKNDYYKKSPYRVLLLPNHVQPVNLEFLISIHNANEFTVKAESKTAWFTNVFTGENSYIKEDWSFQHRGKFGELIETPEMAFIIEHDSTNKTYKPNEFLYGFLLTSVSNQINSTKSLLDVNLIDRESTVVEINMRSTSDIKGRDFVNELIDVYSTENLNRKNHIADVTIDYIESQLNAITDSLSMTENNLQQFRSSRQLLDFEEQATGISQRYIDLQNQLAELTTRKRYYDYLEEYLSNNEDFSNIAIPASMGVQEDQLNTLVADLITAQTQRSNLIQNNQERNPLVQRLAIQIENTKRAIIDIIAAVQKTTEISIDEMNKRIYQVEAEISRLPQTQRQLISIERNYRLNEAIYNYLLEKRAEAKISRASNMPDNIIIEPAHNAGIISPNIKKNYLIALALGIILPYIYLLLKSVFNDKIEYQENIERLTDFPLVGKIPHSKRKTNNVVFEYPMSRITESYRALRTNLEYKFKDLKQKVILVTSSMEGEGKSFNALNLAMNYAQLGKKTLLVDFDLRKVKSYFSEKEILPIGLSSFFTNEGTLEDIIFQSPHDKLDYIPAGPIPPNPIELITLNETSELINQLRERYDCIILDSTPLAQVADAYLLLDYADIKIIIARYNHTLKKVFRHITKDIKEKNINNVCIVLNDNKVYRDQYGYGYGYEKSKRKFLFWKI